MPAAYRREHCSLVLVPRYQKGYRQHLKTDPDRHEQAQEPA
jgi:hypothetical protein